MSRSSPFVIVLTDAGRAELERRIRCYTLPYAEVVRAKVVLLAADGLENTVIAERLDVSHGVVSRWRKRFAQEGVAGLADRPRAGRPRVYPAAVVAQVKAMACEPPEDRGVPQSRWPVLDLAAEAVVEGLVESVSRSTVRRRLDADVIRPWQYPVVDLPP
jgi:transposase